MCAYCLFYFGCLTRVPASFVVPKKIESSRYTPPCCLFILPKGHRKNLPFSRGTIAKGTNNYTLALLSEFPEMRSLGLGVSLLISSAELGEEQKLVSGLSQDHLE